MAKKNARSSKKSPAAVFQFDISLSETDPRVWRRVLVPEDFTLEALHSVFQLVMGWQMSNLYDFQIGKLRYAEPDEFGDIPARDVSTTLAKALKGIDQFTYNYDFGDSWKHIVDVEGYYPLDNSKNYPICIAGENACPPEDCGGFPGFERLKSVIADSSDPEHDEIMTWLGGFYNPFSFDPNRINRDMLWMVDWKKNPDDQRLYHPFKDL